MKFLLALIFLFLTPGAAYAIAVQFSALYTSSNLWIYLSLGFVAGIPVSVFLINSCDVVGVFEHELTHALMALALLRKVTAFTVTRHSGGFVQHSGVLGGQLGDHLITLAPYFLPTFTLITALIYPFQSGGWRIGFGVFIGFTFAYHTISTYEEIGRNWHKGSFRRARSSEMVRSDVGRLGYLFSAISITALTLITHGMTLYLITGGYSGLRRGMSLNWEASSSAYATLYQLLAGFFH